MDGTITIENGGGTCYFSTNVGSSTAGAGALQLVNHANYDLVITSCNFANNVGFDAGAIGIYSSAGITATLYAFIFSNQCTGATGSCGTMFYTADDATITLTGGN